MADEDGKARCGRKRGERLPVDLFRQNGFEDRLVWLMWTGHLGSPRYERASKRAVRDHRINLASSVIAALSTFETGQFFSASPAKRAKPASSRFGTFAQRVSAERLIRNPWPSCSSVTAASVTSSVGVKPAPWRPKASAMVKQPACAAAISSSGLVPFSLSKRVLNE